MPKRPVATDYLSTQEFVADFDKWASESLTGYSRRSFARWAKVASPNFLSLVITGQRFLHGQWLNGFVRAAKMATNEESHLRLLSQFEKARNSHDRSRLLSEIQNSLSKMNVKSLARNQLEILTSPLAWTIFHMLDLEDQKPNSLWLKHRLRFLQISGPEISQALSLLKVLGLVHIKDGKLQSRQKLIESPNQVKKEANALFHKYVLQEAAIAIDSLSPDERAYGSLTATVKRSKLEALKEEINRFGQHLMQTYSSVEPVDGEVVRLNIQLYPLTQKIAAGERNV